MPIVVNTMPFRRSWTFLGSRIVHMPGLVADGGSWVATFLRSVVEESNRRRQGGEAMLEVGYENEAAFSRAFKRTVGESPAAWRRSRRFHARAKTAARDRA